jgi:outer membrane protein OmpA-like peptidoglycan-associated protein
MVDEKGCPIDTDGDGVFDFEDKCLDVPGIKENKGCPEIKEEVKQVFQKALNGIEFNSGKATIKRSSNTILNDIAKIMTENPAYLLSINGHTDNTGDAAKNQTLSEERANAVKAYLESKGIAGSRMTAQGFGQDQPVASNNTASGRAKNRRVEFIVNF